MTKPNHSNTFLHRILMDVIIVKINDFLFFWKPVNTSGIQYSVFTCRFIHSKLILLLFYHLNVTEIVYSYGSIDLIMFNQKNI